jgi:AmiR/NasT family two-component response regulator
MSSGVRTGRDRFRMSRCVGDATGSCHHEEARFRLGICAARPMTRLRVLVCEEDAEIVRSITSVLDAAGFEALPASDPHVAWDDTHSQLADFAMLDISPPYRDDMALARRLAHARVPFVVVSSRDDSALIERAIAAGAMGCFFKPLDVGVIVPSIRAWIARAAELVHLQHEQQSLLGALRHHRSIGAAVGIIMERHGLTPEGAFDALRRRARNERQSVAKLASAVVAGTVNPEPPTAAG